MPSPECPTCQHADYCLRDRLYAVGCKIEPAEFIANYRKHIRDSSAHIEASEKIHGNDRFYTVKG